MLVKDSTNFVFGLVGAAVPMVEAMAALVLVDQLMAHYAQCNLFPLNQDLQVPLSVPRLEEVTEPASLPL